MRRSYPCPVVITGVVGICLVFAVTALAQTGKTVQAAGPASMRVEFASICRRVVDRNVVDAGTRFPASVGRLCCFTKIVGAQSPSEITHVWYFRDAERARVTLAVNGARWRTFSSKIIQSHEIGAWRVDVLGPDGALLTSVHFEIFA